MINTSKKVKSAGRLCTSVIGLYVANKLIRMAKLEILDELEEWRLLSAHYCVAWAYKANDFAETFSGIQLLQQQPSLVRK